MSCLDSKIHSWQAFNTSVVYSSHKRTYLWVETLPWIDCSVMTTYFCSWKIVSVLGEFVNIIHIWRHSTLMFSDSNTSVSLFLAHKRTSLWVESIAMNRLFSHDRTFLYVHIQKVGVLGEYVTIFHMWRHCTLMLSDSTHL